MHIDPISVRSANHKVHEPRAVPSVLQANHLLTTQVDLVARRSLTIYRIAIEHSLGHAEFFDFARLDWRCRSHGDCPSVRRIECQYALALYARHLMDHTLHREAIIHPELILESGRGCKELGGQ